MISKEVQNTDRNKVQESIDSDGDVQVSDNSDGLPNWKPRALSSEFIEAGQKRTGFDMPLFLITLVMLLISLVMMLSASFARAYFNSGEPTSLFVRHLIFSVSGVALMILVSRFKVSTISRWSFHLLLVSFVLLVVVLVAGRVFNNARRWIGVGELTFQPSEIVKAAIVLSFAQMMCKFGKARMSTFRYGVLPFVAISVFAAVLLFRQPHYSAAIIIITISVIMMFAGGTRIRWFVIAGLLIVAAAGLFLILSMKSADKELSAENANEQITQTVWGDSLGYAGKRIDAWLNPEADSIGDGWQTRQSLYAIGSGGLLGQGLGQSRQKYLYLPEETNDYIFSVICEELGFVGVMLILILFVLLIVRGFWLALHAKDKYGSLVIIGLTSLLAIQVFLNVAVVTNLLPATGISLPFFSYGGTALWIQLVEVGIILAVSREIPASATRKASTDRTQIGGNEE